MAVDHVLDTERSVLIRSHRTTFVFCVIAALAVLACAFHGLGVDVDGTAYLNAGVSYSDGQGLTEFGGPFTLFAPALPVLIAFGVRIGLSAQSFDLILNVVCAVLTVVLGRVLLKRHVSDPHLVLAGTVFFAIGWPLIQVTSLALTEPLTIVVVLLLILVLEDFATSHHPTILLGIIAVLLNLGFFLRYAGLSFVPVAVIITFFARRNSDGLSRRVQYSLVLIILSLIGPALWMQRNHSIDGSLLGPRYPSVFGPATVAYQYLLAIAKEFVPGPNFFEIPVFAVLVLATGFAVRSIYLSVPGGREFVRRLQPWTTLLLVCLSYGLYLFFAELSTKIDPVDSRFLVPIYLPCVVLVIGAIEAFLQRSSISDTTKRLTSRLLTVFLCVQILISCVLVGDFAINGRAYTSTAWRSSPLVKATRSVRGAKLIYSNNPEGLWTRLGWQDIRLLPDQVLTASALLACPDVRIVYFTQITPEYSDGVSAGPNATVSLTSLMAHIRLTPVFSDSQGVILRVVGGGKSRVQCSS